MSQEQLNRSIEIEYSIVTLATFKLSMIARNSKAGYKRIHKQQMQAAKIGAEIINQLQFNQTQSHEQ